jgi:hypothetical protein
VLLPHLDHIFPEPVDRYLVVLLNLSNQLILSKNVPVLLLIQNKDFIVTELQLGDLLFQDRLLLVDLLYLVSLTFVL